METCMDMSKMGSASRKPKDEQAVKQEVENFLKQQELSEKKMDFGESVAYIDFPLSMVTDNSNGAVTAKEYSREEYVTLMKPFYESMPKDMNTTHRPTVTVLSDSLADVVDNYTVSVGQQDVNGRLSGLLIKKDGKWLWKTMVEAGWGDVD